ncbi:MAG: DUF4139 domain-containing protein, partial [Pseudomonadota bacterium]
MRLALILACLPGLAWAQDVVLPAPVTDAVIYADGAVLTRRDGAELSAGSHRLTIPVADPERLPQVALEGATLVATSVRPGGLIDGTTLYDDTQRAAQDAVETARTILEAAQDEADRAHAAAEAAQAQLAFWRSVSGGALTDLDPDALSATAVAVSDGVAAAQRAQVESRAALRVAEDAVDEAGAALDQAQRDLEATGARPGPLDLLVLDVDAAGGPVDVTLEQAAAGGWTPLYDAILDEAGGRLTLVRRVEMRQMSGLPLRGVDVLLSTASLYAQGAPSPVFPNPAVIREDRPEPLAQARGADFAVAAPEALAVEADAVVLPDMAVLTYALPGPVDLPAEDDPVVVTLGTLDL